MPATLESLLDRAVGGEELSVEEGLRLLEGPPGELPALLAAATAVREAGHGRTVTWSRKVFLPLTNLCRNRCAYCTFRQEPRSPQARTMTLPEVREWCERGAALGCKEALVCLGDRPEAVHPGYRRALEAMGLGSTAEFAARACQVALEAGLLPHTNAGALTREELAFLRPWNASMGLMLESASPRLAEPGGVHAGSPDKAPSVRRRVLRDAGELRIPFTSGILIGIGETLRERAEALAELRDLSARHGHLQEVIVQNFRAKPGLAWQGLEPGPQEVARTVAVARLLLGPAANLQAPPNLNPQGLRLLLQAGINDWGGLSPVTRDYVNPEAPWPHAEALARTCEEEGFRLVERLAIYPEYVDRPGCLAPGLVPRVRELLEGLEATP